MLAYSISDAKPLLVSAEKWHLDSALEDEILANCW